MTDSFTREKYEEFTSLFDTPAAGHDMLVRTGQQMQTQSDLAKRLGVSLKSANAAGDVAGDVAEVVDAEPSGIVAQARSVLDALQSFAVKADASKGGGELLGSKGSDAVVDDVPVDPVPVDPDSLTLDSSNLEDGVSPTVGQVGEGFPLENPAGAEDDGQSMSIDDFVATTTREAAKAASGAVAQHVSTQMADVLVLMSALTDKVIGMHDQVEAQAALNNEQMEAVKSAVAGLQAQYGELDQNMPPMATIDRLRTMNKSAGGQAAGDAGLRGAGAADNVQESFVNPLVGDTFGFGNSY